MASLQCPRICLIIPHLGGGGAEHVIETLARNLNTGKYEIHLVLTGPCGAQADSFPKRITIHQLRARRVRHSALRLLRLIRQLQPSALLSGIAHLNLLLLLLRPLLPRATRIIVRQNGALSASFAAHHHPRLARCAYSLAYRRADKVVCQSESMAHEIACQLRVPVDKLLVLPNPTDVQSIRQAAPSCEPEDRRLLLLAVGRLAAEKGFDTLLDAFAGIRKTYPSADLIIAGEGPLKTALIERAQALGILDRVHLPGYVLNPHHQFGHASLFVISSRTEGLPNALLEAAAAGLPIVAAPASSDIIDLLQGKEGAWLASDTSSQALRSAIETALQQIQLRRRFTHQWIVRFDLSCAIPAYENVLDRLVAGVAT